jgi:hypothetical protein
MRIGLNLQKTIELRMMFNLILIHDVAMILLIFNCNNYLSKEREKERKNYIRVMPTTLEAKKTLVFAVFV